MCTCYSVTPCHAVTCIQYSFSWNGLLEADHGRHTKGPYQKRGHQSQPWHLRGYSRKNPGKKTTILRSCGQNGPTPSTIALYGRVEGNRPEGRPRKRWLDNVTDDCYHHGWSVVEATHLATDRQCWRSYIRLSQPAPASPWQQEDKKMIVSAVVLFVVTSTDMFPRRLRS